MIQATGLTLTYRRGRAPALVDLGFEAPPGRVTVLLGSAGAGKSTAVRLMLGLERGRGAALFNGRPYRALRCPERQVGVMLQSVRPGGHPGRRARGQLRMLAAALGVPARRADQLLEQIGFGPVADHRLRTFSRGMKRRLSLAVALLGDPAMLLLDAPTAGLSPRDAEWFHAFLRAFAASGGTVLVTCSDPAEAGAVGHQVITLDQGRAVADQPLEEFLRTRLRPEVAVRGPQAGRLADLLLARGAEVRRESGSGIAVSGLARTEIGEIAYRNGIMLHELADRIAELPVHRTPAPVSALASSSAPALTRTLAFTAAPGADSAASAAPAASDLGPHITDTITDTPDWAADLAVPADLAIAADLAIPADPMSTATAATTDAAVTATATHAAATHPTAAPHPTAAAHATDRRPRLCLPDDPEETVVILRPGAAVAATVVGPLVADRGSAAGPGPTARDRFAPPTDRQHPWPAEPAPSPRDPAAGEQRPRPSRAEHSARRTPWSE